MHAYLLHQRRNEILDCMQQLWMADDKMDGRGFVLGNDSPVSLVYADLNIAESMRAAEFSGVVGMF